MLLDLDRKTGALFPSPRDIMALPVSPTVSVSDEACAEVNGLKASRFFSMAERLNTGSEPFIWLFIRPPWSVSGSCCKAVVHDSLRAECQLQRVSPGKAWDTASLSPVSVSVGQPEARSVGRLKSRWRCRRLSVGLGFSSAESSHLAF